MKCGRGDSFPFNFEPKEFPLGLKSPFNSKLKGKLSLQSYSIKFESKYLFATFTHRDIFSKFYQIKLKSD